MRREEKREKMYFLQMSSKFFEEIAVKRLVLTGGNDALVIYLRIWCKSLETGGVIELTGMGMEPAEEIALMIDCQAVPQVASVLTMCQAYGLITVGEGDSGKIINFSLTEDYTRAWTREAIMRRNDKANRIEATEAPAMIEAKTEPETKPEKKKKAEPVRHRYGEYKNVLLSDEDMEKLQAEFPDDYQERIEDLSEYMESKNAKYKNHLATIRAWARRDAKKAQKGQQKQTTQKPQATTRATIKAQLEADGVISFEGVDRSRWEKVQSKYTNEAKPLALEIMKANEI